MPVRPFRGLPVGRKLAFGQPVDEIHDMTVLAAVASGFAVRTAVGSVIPLMDRLTHCVGKGDNAPQT